MKQVRTALRSSKDRRCSSVGIDTSIARALLAIPFHIACTGYAGCELARQWFIIPPILSTPVATHPHPSKIPSTFSSNDGARQPSSCTSFIRALRLCPERHLQSQSRMQEDMNSSRMALKLLELVHPFSPPLCDSSLSQPSCTAFMTLVTCSHSSHTQIF